MSHHGASSPAANVGTGRIGVSVAGANGVHRCCAQTSNDAVGQLGRKSKEHSQGWGTLGSLVAGSGTGSITTENIWARRCPDSAAASVGNGTSSVDPGGGEGNSGSKTGVKHALRAFENKLENVLTGHIGTISPEHHHHHSGKAAEAHVVTEDSSHPEANAVPTTTNRFSAGVAWTNTTGKSSQDSHR